jgi:hypothetical protein
MNRKLIYTAALLAATVTAVSVSLAQNGPVQSYTATTANISGANDNVRIDILRWSTDAERDQLNIAWTDPNKPSAGRGRAARPTINLADDPTAVDAGVAPAPAAGRGGGRGGRGRGGDAAPPTPKTPEGALADAIPSTPVVGYLWSSEVAGYAIHYALKMPADAGTERIILITDRRLGAWNDNWKPASGEPSKYDFSIIELRVNARGEGEGKTSLTGKVAFDGTTKTLGLENYTASPVILKNLKRKTT